MLKVQILGCEELMPMDRNGKSDPFITLSLLSHRYTTTVAKRTTNPTWGDAVYEFPVYMSLAGDDDGDGDPTKRNPNRIPEDCPWRTGLGALEFVVWDKDMLRKEYLGEVAVGVGEWFGERREERKESGDKGRKESGDREGERKAYGFDEVGNEVSFWS
ncbi:C2 domain-containing protein [Mycena floridula]|nr:C2 domain-containing protein [Mycena floridula]